MCNTHRLYLVSYQIIFVSIQALVYSRIGLIYAVNQYIPSQYREYTMLRTLVISAALLASSQAFAEGHPEITRFCSWKANAARVIAMNRDIGLKEVELIGHYLDQGNDYEEQKIVLSLIDKIYGPYQFVTNDTIFLQTRKTCIRDFYINPSKEITVSKL